MEPVLRSLDLLRRSGCLKRSCGEGREERKGDITEEEREPQEMGCA